MKKQITIEQARIRLEELCVRSEQCTADLLRRLALWQIDSKKARMIVDGLVDEKFVDDTRFAHAFVRDKYRFSGWGRYKIRAALAVRRIPGDVIDEALGEIDAVEYQRKAFSALKARLASLSREDIDACRLKLLRFGASRGYETSLVMRIINSRSLWQ